MGEQQTQNPTTQIEKLLYKPKEAAVVIGVSASWVYARIADATLPSVKLAGRMVRIKFADLMEFISAGERLRPPVLQQPTARSRSRTPRAGGGRQRDC